VSDEINVAATLENDSALRARINLARRMVEMDLMTMFSTDGKLLGYNIHIPASKSGSVTGGARTRAFNALKKHAFLSAIFMCSQDGQTTFTELNYVKE
jgi:phage-related baseplate assembly protein